VTKILVGSAALQYWYPDECRTPVDIDVWTDEEDAESDGVIDVCIMPKYIIDFITQRYCRYQGSLLVPTPDVLYTIKLAHMGWDVFWDKHKKDVLFLMGVKDCVLDEQLFNILVDHWKTVHGDKKYLSLSKTKDEFFNDHVTYVYDHDYLHELVAYPNPPLYTKCLKDGENVLIDKKKFDRLNYTERINMFQEEITTIAIERWLVNPANTGRYHWIEAYLLALRKTVTSLTKGWATEFILKNLRHFTPKWKMFEHAINTLKEGEVIMANQIEQEEKVVLLNQIYNAYKLVAKQDGEYYSGVDGFLETILFGETYNTVSPIPFYEFVEQYGGGEGGSEYCYSIFKYDDEYYKATYSYRSYSGFSYQEDGIEYTQLFKVTPVNKSVTVYE
jgi:hypothetical protein